MSKIRGWIAVAIAITDNADVITTSKKCTIMRAVPHRIGTLILLHKNILVPNPFDGIFRENKKALLYLHQYPAYVHCLSANSPNMKPSLLQITVMIAPLLSHLTWKSSESHPSPETQYRSSKSTDTPSSNNQLSIWKLWCLDKIFELISPPCKMKDADSPGN